MPAPSIPAEITSEKDKQAHGIILFLDFTDLTLYYSSRAYTLDLDPGSRAYDDQLGKGQAGQFNTKMAHGINRLGSTSTMRVTLLEWKNTLRGDMIGSAPDLTGSAVDVYIKFDTDNELDSNRLKIFSGVVGRYNIKKDRMSLTLETQHVANLAMVPGTLLIDDDNESEAASDTAVPLQYGDFNWGDDPLFFADIDSSGTIYAMAPYYKTDEANDWFFRLAGHEMNEIPAAADIQLADVPRGLLFLLRDGFWCHVYANSATISNGASEAEIVLEASGARRVDWFGYPQEEFTAHSGTTEASDNMNAFDGAVATTGTAVGTGDERLVAHNWGAEAFTEVQQHEDSLVTIDAYIYITGVTGTTPYGTAAIRKKSDDSVFGVELTIDSGTSLNQWVKVTGAINSFDFPLIDDVDGGSSDGLYLEVKANSGDTITVAGFILTTRVTDFAPGNDPILYVECIGREFSGTWESRKTSGNPIDHPIDALESVFRDEWSFSDDQILDDTFDTVSGEISAWKASFSMIKQVSAKTFLNDFARAWGVGISISPVNEALVMLGEQDIDFTDSGTATAGDEDIFTDAETVSAGSFDKHPILRNSFKLDRTNPRDVLEKLTIQYRVDHSGNFAKLTSTGSGAETLWKNDYTGYVSTASALASKIHELLGQQNWLASFTTFFNACTLRLGDMKSVQHDDINAAMLPQAVATQKWIVVGYGFRFSKGTMTVKLLALPPAPPS